MLALVVAIVNRPTSFFNYALLRLPQKSPKRHPLKTLVSLGTTAIPRILTSAANAHLGTIPDVNAREAWTIHRQWPGATAKSALRYLDERFVPFLDSKLTDLGMPAWAEDHAMMVFRNVGLHNDDDNYIKRRAAGFFHIILRGKGKLMIPGATDPSMRQLQLERGAMFFMNPRVMHKVVDASSGPIVSLTVTTLPPPSCI